MANNNIKSINLLPEFFRTDKNSKFLSSTLDQLIQPPQLERVDGYIGSKLTPTYNSTSDVYISETLDLRRNYQLEPALIINDTNGQIQSASSIDDLSNELVVKGGTDKNFDRLYRPEIYSYNPRIDWDKLINYQDYYWLTTGPATVITSASTTDVESLVSFITPEHFALSNGMKIQFSNTATVYIVEGVGTSITLVDYNELNVTQIISTEYTDNFDTENFDDYPFDNFKQLPVDPEYITINRASKDRNPWSRYNRWVHSSVIAVSATVNGITPEYPADKRAQRPIIEFKPDLKLYNFGSIGIDSIDFIDNTITNAFGTVNGALGYYIDGRLLEHQNRVVFNADSNPAVRGKIYVVNFVNVSGEFRITLVPADDFIPVDGASTIVNYGNNNKGKTWWYTGTEWKLSQQHNTLNQPPLFDLFDSQGHSYSDSNYNVSNFTGNKVFGYAVASSGTPDTILGFPLQYKNSSGVGSYLFNNYFMTDSIILFQTNLISTTISTGIAYLKQNDNFINVWEQQHSYNIPILQFQSNLETTSTIELTAIDNPVNAEFTLDVFVNGTNTHYSTSSIAGRYYINFNQSLPPASNVLFKIYTNQTPTDSGYYETPLGQTNNTLNGVISNFTLSELQDHVSTMIDINQGFIGDFPGVSNLRDLPDRSAYGTRLISNANPLSFANLFIGRAEHSVIDSIEKASDQYNQFKLAFLNQIKNIDNNLNSIEAVDEVLKTINRDKNSRSSWHFSDMIAYGQDKITRTWIVSSTRNTIYPITAEFGLDTLSLRSVLVYINGVQLLKGTDYVFLKNNSSVEILKTLSIGDQIVINDYNDTSGSYVPSTPTKLGLYPAYEPKIIIKNNTSYIQGHDGSLMKIYNDYRDSIILEYERRIFNNLKINYRPELFDINSVVPGPNRITDYSLTEINDILESDFLRWAGLFGLDYTTNSFFDDADPFTWNYTGSSRDYFVLTGYWRAVYRYYYDTDRPDICPWEMLGLSIKPNWWDETYDPGHIDGTPYSSNLTTMWYDIAHGRINGEVNSLYIRPYLSHSIPVDILGNLKDPQSIFSSNITPSTIRESFVFGDQGPVEYVWRSSSHYPFAVQKMLALTKPASYASLLFDTSRMNKNIAGQWTYGSNYEFLNLRKVILQQNATTLTAGYSNWVTEIGTQRNNNYVNDLQNILTNLDFRLFHKVGGFISKNKIQVLIDAYEPNSTSIGAILPQEDYSLFLNVSNPVTSVGISGIIVQKSNGQFILKGYNNKNPYFNINQPYRNISTPTITIGGVSESYLVWAPSGTSNNGTGLSTVDTTTAVSSNSNIFYQQGQIVSYNNKFYRVVVSHRSGSTFDPTLFASIPSIPTIGGVSVQIAAGYSKEITSIQYGSKFNTLQEVYDVIIGYGQWLTNQGFVFDEYNADFGSVIDWSFSGKEFLYWTTQNWADNSVITLSPFANQIKFSLPTAVVDNVFNSFYEYSILQAQGKPLSQKNISVNRQDGVCTITTKNTTDGIYFAQINAVQKEHAMVFNNKTIFNDIIFDIETGYRQQRMKLIGFRTSNWNGDIYSPGFVYDTARVVDWQEYTDYNYGDVVRFSGNYYSAKQNIEGSVKFNATNGWILLGSKPVADLLPNFDYKIRQFEDFYSLDIDNFDVGQEKMAQHLTGYTPRTYLNDIFTDPIAQYKFYQGYIREKGTKNSISKLAKASIHNLLGQIDYNEEWAFRVGNYGSYSTYQEIEFPLIEGNFVENPQIISMVDSIPTNPGDLIEYVKSSEIVIKPEAFDVNNVFATTTDTPLLTTAGYVHLDDVNATAYNENSLLDIANNSAINEGTMIWLGFKSNGDWDVLRYEKNDARIVGVFVSIPVSELTFTTDLFHGLQVGDIVSVTQFNSQVNGVYRITAIPKLTQFSVATTIASIVNQALISPGILYKFVSHRYSSFDNVPSDKNILKLSYGSKLWIDNNGNDQWAVYEKIQNYNKINIPSAPDSFNPNEQLGQSISKPKGTNKFVVGAPNYNNGNAYPGRIFFYTDLQPGSNLEFDYSINETQTFYNSSDSSTSTGYSLVYDAISFSNGYGLIFAGAPGVGQIKSNSISGGLRYSTGIETPSTLAKEGLVKISSVNNFIQETAEYVLLSPNNQSYEKFGKSIFVQRNTGTKIVLVGAPGTSTTGSGAVYSYTVDTTSTPTSYAGKLTTSTLTVTYNGPINFINTFTVGSLVGYSISGTDDASLIAIGAPGKFSESVYIVNGITRQVNQTISSGLKIGSQFGKSVVMSPQGDYLLVSAPEVRNDDQSYGCVKIYNQSNGIFTLTQTIVNPVPGAGMKFGIAIDINTSADELVITAVGHDTQAQTTFDADTNQTIYDNSSTIFVDVVENAGTAYVYNRKNTRFVLADNLTVDTQISNSYYGTSVALDDTTVYVGAPASSSVASAIHQFTKIDKSAQSWTTLRQQEPLVNPDQFRRVALLDTFNDVLVDYLDVYDPVKGYIGGIADQELKYKSTFDPAIYSIGVSGTVVDTDTNWLDEHVGELWWDLSTVKYFWYEQGDLEYRKNHWGSTFPGATIDVYEWVGSDLLPTEWSTIADTSAGLLDNISGQPKYIDNSVISVKQIYNKTTNNFSNRYYYWVKNKITVPNVQNRRISAYQVASLIANPTAYGEKYISAISPTAVALANIGSVPVDSRIHLNIASDAINNPIERHTEWLLLQENSAGSVPSAMLEKKLIDSLLGHDKLGNLVPDPSLSDRQAYGIEIRPRQSMFKNRSEALRNIIEFVNGVLAVNQITGNYSFDNLNAQELPPTSISHDYDVIVEDNDSLSLIDTRTFKQAKATCTVVNGKIVNVIFSDLGYGYKISPSIIIRGSGSGAVISTTIDNFGQISGYTIDNPGSEYITAPTLIVRPYTVIVLSDSSNNGLWAKFVWDFETQQWDKQQTQSYNTSLYWKYIDWASTDYNPFIDYTYTVNSTSDLSSLPTLSAGQYVKVLNGGDGNYIILEQVEPGTAGNFDSNFSFVYKQNGTIQISDSLWSTVYNSNNWDYLNSYDQTLFDQTPTTELGYILTALKNDIFVVDLKINWNLLFFKAVKYALSEQKILDWAFKTSFINVTNYAGTLDQRSVYKLQDSSYYESYLAEVKPYHTQVRTFTTNYKTVDPTNSYVTDFDLPGYYDISANAYVPASYTSSLTTSTYPWKSWYINSTTNLVRQNTIGIKFDRVSVKNNINSTAVVDNIICDGYNDSFVLSWLAHPDKLTIDVSLDGNYVLNSNYNLVYYTELQSGYFKKLSKIVFLNYIPSKGQNLSVSYIKNIELFNATDRVLNYYEPTSGMPGIDLPQVMEGIEYSGTTLEGLPFDYTTAWDVEYYNGTYSPFGVGLLSDDVGFYITTTSTVAANTGTSTLIVDLIDYLEVGQYINVISTTTNVWNTTTVYITSVDPLSNEIQVSATTTEYLATGTIIEVWNIDNNSNSLDSEVIGGDFGSYNPEVIFEGNLSRVNGVSYGPEELVPGGALDTLALNVYTRYDSGSPLIMTRSTPVNPDNLGQIIRLPMVMPIGSTASIIVSFNHQKIFEYTSNTNFTTSTQYTIDWTTSTTDLIISPQTSVGYIGYSIVGVGGLSYGSETGLIDQQSVTFNDGSTSATIVSVSGVNTVHTATVYVNGMYVPRAPAGTNTTTNNLIYELVDGIAGAEVNIYNISTDPTTAVAWFFGTEQKYFNEIKEQIINGPSYSGTDLTPETNFTIYNYTLLYPPGIIEPSAPQAVVEMNIGNGWKILRPPIVSYYTITNTSRKDYNINNLIDPTSSADLSNTDYDLNNVSVFVNGRRLHPGVDFSVQSRPTSPQNNITLIKPRLVKRGDVLAIMSKPYNSSQNVYYDWDYDIVGNTLSIVDTTGNITTNLSNVKIRAITYNNQDGMLIQRKQFPGVGPVYKLDRPVLNNDYLWVILNGVPLSSRDYDVSSDIYVGFSDQISVVETDRIDIISFSNQPDASVVLGYRIFNNIFNSSQYTRLSKGNSTYLTQPLYYTDSEIYVSDASVLTQPDINNKIPGVVIIAGERIEFYTVVNNVLGQLNRSTLGTSPAFYLEAGTRVIDQGTSQDIGRNTGWTENILTQTYLTSSTTNTYVISTVTNGFNDGITLDYQPMPTDTIGNPMPPLNPVDQISVYYGGRRLRKSGLLVQNTDIAYDSSIVNMWDTVSVITDLPDNTAIGTAYLITSTNQIWVQSNSKDASAFNGFVYQGLDYVEPEFTVSTGTQQLVLNLPEGILNGVELKIVKKQFARNTIWNDEVNTTETLSLTSSTTGVAGFLQQRPAELPDFRYYGGNPILTLSNGLELTDENNDPLQGI